MNAGVLRRCRRGARLVLADDLGAGPGRRGGGASDPRRARSEGPRRDHSRLLPMGDDRYGVCSWLGQTLSVVEVRTSTTVKKMRVAAPHVSVPSEETVILYAPHGRSAYGPAAKWPRATGGHRDAHGD